MRVLLLAHASSAHTIKWVRSLSARGIEIVLFSLTPVDRSIYKDSSSVRIYTGIERVKKSHSLQSKIKYFRAFPQLLGVIRETKPDILHAHYATSYGLLGALSGFQPFVLSVWGSDVFDFPKISPLHTAILKYNLSRACRILSTSRVMAEETSKYIKKEIEVTPFGVDLQRFQPRESNEILTDGIIQIGTVKALEETYGIEYLIRAFKVVVDRNPGVPIRLLIIGGGSLELPLKKLTHELRISDLVVFQGRVSFDEVPKFHTAITIAVYLSLMESFGVSVLEAQACGNPVVVSNVGGLPEIVEDGITGFVVQTKDVEAAAEAIERLVIDSGLRKRMGDAARKHVENKYDWEKNVEQMVNIYKTVFQSIKSHSVQDSKG